MDDFAFKEFLKVLLEFSERDAATITELQAKARIPREETIGILSSLKEEGIIDEIDDEVVELRSIDRIKLSLAGIERGMDVEAATRYLSWKDFEGFIGRSLRAEGFKVLDSFYFTNERNKHQIDILGIRKPLILSIDCKHWRFRTLSSKVSAAAKAHIERTRALADYAERKGEIKGLSLSHGKYYMLPVIVLLMEPYTPRIVLEVPMVPVLKFKDFLRNVPPIPGFEPLRYIPITIKAEGPTRSTLNL